MKKNEGRGMKEEDEENKRTKEGDSFAYWGDRLPAPTERISSSVEKFKSTKLAP